MTTSDYCFVAALEHQSDQDVVDALRYGQLRALDVLFQRYGIKIYSLAYRILADAEEAESMTQEIFASLWQTDTWQLEPDTIDSFLMTLTRSRSLAQVERRGWGYAIAKHWHRLFPAKNHGSFVSPSQQGSDEGHWDTVCHSLGVDPLLSTLSRTDEEILRLAYSEVITVQSLANRLNVPVKIAQHRSRKALMKLHHNRLTSKHHDPA